MVNTNKTNLILALATETEGDKLICILMNEAKRVNPHNKQPSLYDCKMILTQLIRELELQIMQLCRAVKTEYFSEIKIAILIFYINHLQTGLDHVNGLIQKEIPQQSA